jgi:hypothetical protein
MKAPPPILWSTERNRSRSKFTASRCGMRAKVAPDRSMSPSPRYMARLRRYGKVTDNIFFDYESMYDGSEAKMSGFNHFTMRGKM